MTLDNDGNTGPRGPRIPSDLPPRRPGAEGAQRDAGGVAAPDRTPAAAPSESNSASDSTSPRGVVRSILAGLNPITRALVVSSLLSYCRALAAVAAAVAAGLSRPTALATADAAARVLLGDSMDLPEVDAADVAPHAPCAGIIGAWFAESIYDLARSAAKGTAGQGDFADLIALLVSVGDGRELAPPASSTDDADDADDTSADDETADPIDADGYPRSLVRAILATVPRPVALVSASTIAAWCRALAGLARAAEAAPPPSNDLSRALLNAGARETAVIAAQAATDHTNNVLPTVDGVHAAWRAMLAAWFGASADALAQLRHGAGGLDALAIELDGFPFDGGPDAIAPSPQTSSDATRPRPLV